MGLIESRGEQIILWNELQLLGVIRVHNGSLTKYFADQPISLLLFPSTVAILNTSQYDC